MVFLPKEAQDKIQNLEKEVKKLQQANQELHNNALQKKDSFVSTGTLVFAGLFILALIYIGYNAFNPIGLTVSKTESLQPDSLTLYLDGRIEKMTMPPQGEVIYRVQIGAFKAFNLEQYNINLDAMEQITIDGITKVTLGGFSRLQDAQTFQQQMVRMGLDKCYIVAYKNKTELGNLLPQKEQIKDSTLH